ncbi:MAG: peptidylprolyl isomerase, partial [Rhodospirillales bacterium]|nr:peptidylprolyl isomerase [Rhodospirillales bacterium]
MNRSNKFCRRIIFVLVMAFGVNCVPISPAQSQNSLNIAAVVNDDVISIYDLSQRILSVITFSNLPNTVETQQRIAPDILRRLIAEKLRLQEAKRLNITVPDEDIKKAIDDLERQNKIPSGQMDQMLLSHGVDPESLKQQLVAELSWIGVISTLFRNVATVSDQEVEDVITKMKENAGKPEYLVSEIFLAYDEKPKNEVIQIAQRIHAQLTAGASWPQIAQNFSESASAKDGGDLGWNLASDLGQNIGSIVSRLEPGQMSSPVTTDDGVYILYVREKRVAKGIEASPEEVTLGIQQLHLNIPANANSQTVTG